MDTDRSLAFLSPEDTYLLSLLRMAQVSLNVKYLAETDLQYVPPGWTASKARAWLKSNGFDAAPVQETEPHRFIALDGGEQADSTVSDIASPIDAQHLVTSTLSLADGVGLLRDRPYFFVMDGQELVGIVTRSDLQRPAVSMVVFSLVLAAESAISRIIEQRLGSEWYGALSEKARKEIEKLYQQRVETNTEITRLECLTLSQRLDLLHMCPGAREDLGFDRDQAYAMWRRTLLELRNELAHGRSILSGVRDPIDAIELFREVRMFAERLWQLARS